MRRNPLSQTQLDSTAEMSMEEYLQSADPKHLRVAREDIKFDTRVWEKAKTDPNDAFWRAAGRHVFFRVGKPRLGEPLYHPGGTLLNMSCGRGTGHLGSGMYFFGTLGGAVSGHASYSETEHSSEESFGHRRNSLSSIYRIVGGPQTPFVANTFDDTRRLHDFGKALICVPSSIGARDKLSENEKTAKEDLKRIRDELGGDSDEAYYAEENLKKLRKRLGDAERDVHKYELILRYHGPRLDSDLERASKAIDRAFLEKLYHPMTYYMRSLGYDGVLHADWTLFNTGDFGNIWYPEV